MMRPPLALVVEDDHGFRESLELLVRKEGFEVRGAGSLAEAHAVLAGEAPDVALVDLELPDGSGLEFLGKVGEGRDERRSGPNEVIVITGHGSVDSAVEALRRGALDYLCKPFDRSRLKSCLAHVARTRALKQEVAGLRSELRRLGHFGDLIGRSPAIQRVFDLVERVAPTEVPVLISGESGTGKEVVAHTIHGHSARAAGPLLPINCGAVPATLMESELFGHERGSFTGAEQRRAGCFERAAGGTLFLDEITEMPVELQVKLLRVLESRVVVPLGGSRTIEVDTRVIAATNRDPQQAVADGVLRRDLYYRLNVFPLHVPPLRERGEDVGLLAEHFLAELNAAHGTAKAWRPGSLARLSVRSWPGNVRELKNLVQRAFILAEEVVEVPDAGADERGGRTGGRGDDAGRDGAASGPGGGPRRFEVAAGTPILDVERRLIETTLDELEGDKAATAAALGISLRTLYNRLGRYAAMERGASGQNGAR